MSALRGFVLYWLTFRPVPEPVAVGVRFARAGVVALDLVAVRQAIAISIPFARVGVVALDLVAVRQAVAVGVRFARAGVEPSDLGRVAQAVAVGVASRCGNGGRLLPLGRGASTRGRGGRAGKDDRAQYQPSPPTPHRHIVAAVRARLLARRPPHR